MDKVISKKRLSTRKVAIGSVCAIIGIAAFASYSGVDSGRSIDIDGKRLTISTVRQTHFEESIPLRANIESSSSIFIDAMQGGRVEELLVEEGAVVKEGDVILTLSNARLQLDVISRESDATEQLNNLQNTRHALEQNTMNLKEELINVSYEIETLTRRLGQLNSLLEKKVIAVEDYQRVKDELEYKKNLKNLTIERIKQDSVMRSHREKQLNSSIEKLEQNILVAKAVIENLKVRAPQDGQLVSLKAELGESKAEGENLGVIDKVDSFKASALVSEFYLNKIKIDQAATFEKNSKKYKMRVSKIFSEVENSQFKVELTFVNGMPDNLKRGQTIPLKLEISNAENANVLDNGPFFNDTGGSWVFVISDNGRVAEKRKITLGRRTPDQVEVLKGLQPGDKVITSTYKSYLDADKVIISPRVSL